MNITITGISPKLAKSLFSGWITPEPEEDLVTFSATIKPVIRIIVYDSMLVITTGRAIHKIDRHDFREVSIL